MKWNALFIFVSLFSLAGFSQLEKKDTIEEIKPYQHSRPEIDKKILLMDIKDVREPASIQNEFDGPDYPSFMGY